VNGTVPSTGVMPGTGSASTELATVNPFEAVGDKITFRWVMKLWFHEVWKRKQREAEEAEKERLRLLEEERKRKMQEEIERRVADIRRRAEALEQRLNEALETIRENEKRIKELEALLEAAEAEAAERERRHQEAMDALRAELLQTKQALSDTTQSLDELRREHADAQDAWQREREANEAEKQRLESAIRQLKSDLQQALVMAKYLRGEMLKAKREAASSVSPAKFAELITQLEDMKDRLGSLFKDYEDQKSTNELLRGKMEDNQRRMELERQFLPLLRQARGPLGPKTGTNMNSDINGKKKSKESWGTMAAPPMGMPHDTGGFDPMKKVRRSASLSSMTRGGPLGGS